ncbi:hypothetical protein M8C21_023576 [Ambrosia artemisiifolia]|uniref:Uncharacterized protein n=1 Tax=Ambrosia artemisiifolia TaxID=4212 RepID=A0AAD5D5U8_AMBAR|nr:hypothetical protein M8C21_023576 [Ambrosia artemisiifolia]
MQCPNCRKVESGRWLFADGSAHAVSETGAQDWMPHESPHDLSYSRRFYLFQPIGLRWHPFGGFMVHSSFEHITCKFQRKSSIQNVAHFLGNYAMIAEHTAAPSSARSYASHFRPNEHVANSNIQHPLNSHPAPSNNIRSTYIQHPSWGWNCHFLPYNADRDFIDHGNLTPARFQNQREFRS